MSLLTIFALSLACVAAFLITLSRIIGWQTIIKHGKAIDVVFTVVLGIVMAGTLTGLLVAIVAGLLMAGVLATVSTIQGGVCVATAKVRTRFDKHVYEPSTPQSRKPEEYRADGSWIYDDINDNVVDEAPSNKAPEIRL